MAHELEAVSEGKEIVVSAIRKRGVHGPQGGHFLRMRVRSQKMGDSGVQNDLCMIWERIL